MAFPGRNLPLPERPFPFHPAAPVSPSGVPDCHLVRTVISRPPLFRQSRCFPRQSCTAVLASFASMVSRGNVSIRCGHKQIAACSSFPSCSLKAGYAARSNTILCTALQVPIPARTQSGLLPEVLSVVAQYQVSTETGSYAPCHWSAPGILNPQHPP